MVIDRCCVRPPGCLDLLFSMASTLVEEETQAQLYSV